MRTPSRRLLALCASLLLLMQALPAFAVCRCDMPQGMSCCGPVSAPEADHGCCASSADRSDSASYQASPCQKDFVDAEGREAALPLAPPSIDEGAIVLVPAAPSTPCTASPAIAGPQRDAPPGPSSTPVHLLHVVLQI